MEVLSERTERHAALLLGDLGGGEGEVDFLEDFLMEDIEEVETASSTDFDQVIDALDKEIKREVIEEEEGTNQNAVSLVNSPSESLEMGPMESSLTVKTEQLSDDVMEGPDAEEGGDDSEFADVLEAFDLEEAEKEGGTNQTSVSMESSSVTSQRESLEIGPMEIGPMESPLTVKIEQEGDVMENPDSDEDYDNSEFAQVLEAFDQEENLDGILEGIVREANIESESVTSPFEDVLDETPVFSGMCYNLTESPDHNDKEFEEQDETVDEIFEDVVDEDHTLQELHGDDKEAKKRLETMGKDWDAIEEDPERGKESETVNDELSQKVGDVTKEKAKESGKEKEIETGKETEKAKESENDFDQKMKKLERATRACRLAASKVAEEQKEVEKASKTKRRTWRQEMDLMKERFQEEKEEDDSDVDEKSRFMKALNLTAKVTSPENADALVNTIREEQFQEATSKESHLLNVEVDVMEEDFGEVGQVEEAGSSTGFKHVMGALDIEEENDASPKGRPALENVGKKKRDRSKGSTGRIQEKNVENIGKKVKVAKLPALPDIMVIEECDLVEFDIARYPDQLFLRTMLVSEKRGF